MQLPIIENSDDVFSDQTVNIDKKESIIAEHGEHSMTSATMDAAVTAPVFLREKVINDESVQNLM